MTDMKLENGITSARMLSIAKSMYDNASCVWADYYPHYAQVRFAYDMFVASYVLATQCGETEYADKVLKDLRACVDDMAGILGREDRWTDCYYRDGNDPEMENYVKEMKEADHE